MKKALSSIVMLLGAFFITTDSAYASVVYQQPFSSFGSATTSHHMNAVCPTGNGSVAHATIYVPEFDPYNYTWITTLGAGSFSNGSTGTFPPSTFVNSLACTPLTDVQGNQFYDCNFATSTTYAINNYTACAGSTYLYFILQSGNTLYTSATTTLAIDATSINTGINGNSYEWVGRIDDTYSSFAPPSVLPLSPSVCNPFSAQITSAFLNSTFSISDCFSFLFQPTETSLAQFQTLASTTQSKFPFSYIASVNSVWSGLVASSTSNSPSFVYNLHDLGIGSTTPLGNILPNATVFSASTTMQYFPSGTFDTLKALAGIAIILVLVSDIFFSTKRMLK